MDVIPVLPTRELRCRRLESLAVRNPPSNEIHICVWLIPNPAFFSFPVWLRCNWHRAPYKFNINILNFPDYVTCSNFFFLMLVSLVWYWTCLPLFPRKSNNPPCKSNWHQPVIPAKNKPMAGKRKKKKNQHERSVLAFMVWPVIPVLLVSIIFPFFWCLLITDFTFMSKRHSFIF